MSHPNTTSYTIIRKATAELGPSDEVALCQMLEDAFDGNFAPEDWQHACGGVHFIAYAGPAARAREPHAEAAPVSHASVVPRELIVGERSFRTGYVEAVATSLAHRGAGLGTRLMRAANELIQAEYELGALSTSLLTFYERIGWERWQGPTFVRSGDEWKRTREEDGGVWNRTREEDGGVMILRTPSSRDLDTADRICCEERPGDDW